MTWRHEMIVHHRPALRAEKTGGGLLRFVSQVVEPRHACTEIVPSWNIVPPAGGGFEVALRVRHSVAGRWSSWQSLGSWGRVQAEQRPPVADDGLQVCVDTLQSREPIIGVQYAITAHGRAEEGHPKVGRFAFCFSRAVAEDEQPRPCPRPEDTSPIKLDVPVRSLPSGIKVFPGDVVRIAYQENPIEDGAVTGFYMYLGSVQLLEKNSDGGGMGEAAANAFGAVEGGYDASAAAAAAAAEGGGEHDERNPPPSDGDY